MSSSLLFWAVIAFSVLTGMPEFIMLCTMLLLIPVFAFFLLFKNTSRNKRYEQRYEKTYNNNSTDIELAFHPIKSYKEKKARKKKEKELAEEEAKRAEEKARLEKIRAEEEAKKAEEKARLEKIRAEEEAKKAEEKARLEIIRAEEEAKKAEERAARRERLRRKELERRNTPCEFSNGISKEEFTRMAVKAAKRIRRLYVTVDSAIITGTYDSQSGLNSWQFVIDYNDFGQITGKRWILKADYSESNIPKRFMELMQEAIKEKLVSNNTQNDDTKDKE